MVAISAFPSLGMHKTAPFWSRYFAQNTERWEEFSQTFEPQRLTLNPDFIKSLQMFQLGEQSEGRCLMHLAQQYGDTHGDPEYIKAIQQFIKEEQRHAHFLKLALQNNESVVIEKDWTDTLFRKIRRLCDLEMMISVLFTAEIIAVAYYGCLAKASEHPLARSLFERICQDEAMHLKFHGEHLRKLRSQGRCITLRSGVNRLFVWLVAGMVWREHYGVLGQTFESFGEFLKRCDGQLSQAISGPIELI
ncbi:ferritin-like domain-containing protein [Leptothoe sp. PORK10 BA2]|uniref:ferritin-like domain-containing protein n=1 Tax=Leptothoe sp. PORK10 BA2 TaxID=3110254 RepID=UPI002B1FDC0E|nr:ferritin-like domain-containing protein [Leptothoe sp. PORK10 BA2]MEA5464495.1 ferritin-like domain-containing protein [Leptothoe sp. PORK10 BA2]